MARTLRNDELNIISYEEYFGEMGISKNRKDARILLAEELEKSFIEFLDDMFLIYTSENTYDAYKLYNELKELIDEALLTLGYDLQNDYPKLASFTEDLAESIVDTTLKNILAETTDTSYWLSDKRAIFMSADTSETVVTATEYYDALNSGKKHKKWNTIMDGKERESHAEANETSVPIDEYFHVGNSYMLYPHDYVSPNVEQKELVNCRCWLTYE